MTQRNAITILILSLVGFAASIYLTNLHYQIFTGALEEFGFCGISREISCETVTASPYSKLFGIPLAWLGAMLYMFWTALASSAIYKPEKNSEITTGLFLLTSLPPCHEYISRAVDVLYHWQPLPALSVDIHPESGGSVAGTECGKGINRSAHSYCHQGSGTFLGPNTIWICPDSYHHAAAGAVGQVKMQKGIEAASQFNEAAFASFRRISAG